jgi:hypothetical protein
MEQQELKGPDKGLGDTIARVTAVTRIDKLAQRIAAAVGAKDCGCSERQKLLNEMFPYRNQSQNKSTEN